MNKSLPSETSALGVSRETVERLRHFAVLFQKWAGTINLVAPSTIGDLWDRHIRDSLQIHTLSPLPAIWADLGSGGGFPGIVTAICLAERNAGWVHLVESNNKKAAFLRTVLQETGARGTVHAVRIEKAPDIIQECGRVSARALADLDQLFGYIEPWAIRNAELKAYLHKGRDYRRELELSHRRWNLDLVIHQSIIEADSVILEVGGLMRKS
jgi:16S rRNA (guanine527-N7)-methyltransferase